MVRKLMRSAVIVALCLALSSCAGSDGGPSAPVDSTPPAITQVSIADGATGVGLIERIEVTFSEPMDATTINNSTLMVVGRSGTGHVGYDESTRTASVTPDTLYPASAPHALVVGGGIADEAGNALGDSDTTLFETGTLDCDHLMDYLEPNDEVTEGTPIEVDRLYRTLSVCGENSDYYHFTVEEPATVTATTTLRHCAENESWGIYFLRADGGGTYATRGVGVDPGETTTFHFSFFPGTYALWLFGYDDPVYVLYDLELVTSEPCSDDPYEDNDFLDEAQPIATGLTTDLTGCYLDADYYTFEVEAGQTVTVTQTQHPHDGSTHSRLRIHDPSGTSESEDDEAMESSIYKEIEQAGTCTIMAKFWADLTYDLNIEIGEQSR